MPGKQALLTWQQYVLSARSFAADLKLGISQAAAACLAAAAAAAVGGGVKAERAD
jgi:hypothetical protein